MFVCVNVIITEDEPSTDDPGTAGSDDFVDAFSAVLNINSDAIWNNRNLRQRIPASELAMSGDTVRVTLRASGNGGFSIDGCYIGHVALSGDPYDFDGAQERVTFNGGSSGVTVGTGGHIVSDEIVFSLDETKALLVAVHFTAAANNIKAAAASGDLDAWTNVASDETSQTDVSSYGDLPDAVYMVSKIEAV